MLFVLVLSFLCASVSNAAETFELTIHLGSLGSREISLIAKEESKILNIKNEMSRQCNGILRSHGITDGLFRPTDFSVHEKFSSPAFDDDIKLTDIAKREYFVYFSHKAHQDNGPLIQELVILQMIRESTACEEVIRMSFRYIDGITTAQRR